MRRWLGLLLLASPLVVPAQVVRGRVLERASNIAIAGVVVEVLASGAGTPGERLGAVLSAIDGTFAIRLPRAGTVILAAKRIGVQRYTSAVFAVGEGETVVRDVPVEAVSVRLPEVTVLSASACSGDPREGARIGSWWDEARTALFATQLSLRDELFTASVTRYVRELDPRNRRVLNETRSVAKGVVSRPFSAIAADSLSAHGYWRGDSDGRVTYYGPDAEVLLSETFVREHCFREARRRRDRRGLVGIAFEPVRAATVPDVSGILWLDEQSAELRFVEFGYRPLPTNVDSSQAGGEVHFARLPSGAWIVRRWFILLPVMARPSAPLDLQPSSSPWVLVRPLTLQLRQEGGEVHAESLVRGSDLVAVTGTLRDTLNQPIAGARIRVAGTRLAAITSTAGTFTVDSVPFGRWTLLAETDAHETLGVVAAEAAIEVRRGEPARVAMRTATARLLHPQVCSGAPARYGYGALRVSVRTAVGDSVVEGLPVALSWNARRNRQLGIEPGPRTRELRTDGQGRVTLCGIDDGLEVSVVVARRTGGSEPVRTVVIPDRGVAGVLVRLSEP